MRVIGMDIHRSFAQIAILADGQVKQGGLLDRDRVKTASQLDKAIMIQRLKRGAVQSEQVEFVFGFHSPTEPVAKSEIGAEHPGGAG